MPITTRSVRRMALLAGIHDEHQQLPPPQRRRRQPPPPPPPQPIIIPPIPLPLPDLPQQSFLELGPLPPPGNIDNSEWEWDTHRSTNYIFNIFDTYIAPGGHASDTGHTAAIIPDYDEFAIEDARREAAMQEPEPEPADLVYGFSVKFLVIKLNLLN